MFGRRCVFLVEYESVSMHHNECVVVMEHCSSGDMRKLINTHMEKKEPIAEEDILCLLFKMGTALQNIFLVDWVHKLGTTTLA